MQTRFDIGDKVYIIGEISRVEIIPDGRSIYYMHGNEDIPFTEDSLIGLSDLLEETMDRILDEKIRSFLWRTSR